MAGQPSSSSNILSPHSNPGNPSFMEDAMASLRFDNAANHSIPYNPEVQVAAASATAPPPRMQPVTRHPANPNNPPTANADPVPGDPDAVFIRAPFTDFPGSSERKTGLSFNDLAANANWFLSVDDFIGPNAVGYPPQLEPPRGWCPAKKKDIKEGWKEGEGPRLRCTLCRRSYSGVNAKSMWRRHVYEKHKIAMANRRDANDRPAGGRGGRSSNSKSCPSRARAYNLIPSLPS
ncbi:hypothetical protein C8Q80DRAFT_49751 [Daedaleopsis nitida]|nr:hypothetical protein C8Q80DRAFT_49751 [Daedaleopsis nitida]